VATPATQVGHPTHSSGWFLPLQWLVEGLKSQFLALRWDTLPTSVGTPREFSGNSCHPSGMPEAFQCLVPPMSVAGGGTSVPASSHGSGIPQGLQCLTGRTLAATPAAPDRSLRDFNACFLSRQRLVEKLRSRLLPPKRDTPGTAVPSLRDSTGDCRHSGRGAHAPHRLLPSSSAAT
jgi:hypothetical protein